MSDFTNISDVSVNFEDVELDDGVDFFDSGDFQTIIIPSLNYGEGDYGMGPYGGSPGSIIITSPTTEWTNIDTP